MKRRRYLLQFYNRCPRIESAEDSLHCLQFQTGRVKLMPERRRKGILLAAWGHFKWRVEVALALPVSGYIYAHWHYIVRNANKAPPIAGRSLTTSMNR